MKTLPSPIDITPWVLFGQRWGDRGERHIPGVLVDDRRGLFYHAVLADDDGSAEGEDRRFRMDNTPCTNSDLPLEVGVLADESRRVRREFCARPGGQLANEAMVWGDVRVTAHVGAWVAVADIMVVLAPTYA